MSNKIDSPIGLKCNLLFIAIIFTSSLSAQWELKKEEDGIKVYTQKVEGSKFNEYRAEGILKGKLERVYEVFSDPSFFLKLDKHTAMVELKERVSPNEMIVYSETDAPFPVRDRASVYRNKIDYKKGRDLFEMSIECLYDHPYYDKDRGKLQVESCKGSWHIKDIGDGNLEVVHQFHAEPGGSLPGWLVNKRTIDAPIETLENLQRLLNE